MPPGFPDKLCAPDVTYVSLNYSNPDLRKIMPWCGTGQGAERIIKTFHDVAEFWHADSFSPEAIFGEGENVAVFWPVHLYLDETPDFQFPFGRNMEISERS